MRYDVNVHITTPICTRCSYHTRVKCIYIAFKSSKSLMTVSPFTLLSTRISSLRFLTICHCLVFVLRVKSKESPLIVKIGPFIIVILVTQTQIILSINDVSGVNHIGSRVISFGNLSLFFFFTLIVLPDKGNVESTEYRTQIKQSRRI